MTNQHPTFTFTVHPSPIPGIPVEIVQLEVQRQLPLLGQRQHSRSSRSGGISPSDMGENHGTDCWLISPLNMEENDNFELDLHGFRDMRGKPWDFGLSYHLVM